MSRAPAPNASDETPPSEPEPNRGLEDPRIIHPSPEGLFPEPTEASDAVPPSEPDPPPREDLRPEDQSRGIVDPRSERIGPDI